jgi:hypothetical protein
MEGSEAGAERMNGRSAHERGVLESSAVLPGGLNGPNLPTQIVAFSGASTTKHARHYAANFGFT